MILRLRQRPAVRLPRRGRRGGARVGAEAYPATSVEHGLPAESCEVRRVTSTPDLSPPIARLVPSAVERTTGCSPRPAPCSRRRRSACLPRGRSPNSSDWWTSRPAPSPAPTLTSAFGQASSGSSSVARCSVLTAALLGYGRLPPRSSSRLPSRCSSPASSLATLVTLSTWRSSSTSSKALKPGRVPRRERHSVLSGAGARLGALWRGGRRDDRIG